MSYGVTVVSVLDKIDLILIHWSLRDVAAILNWWFANPYQVESIKIMPVEKEEGNSTWQKIKHYLRHGKKRNTN